MKKHQAKNKKLFAASFMPPLRHTMRGEKYDRHKSEVLEWMANNPFLQEFIFDRAATAKLIKYDAVSGTWQGVNRLEED